MHRGKYQSSKGTSALFRAAWALPALGAAFLPARASAQVTATLTGSVTADYSSSVNSMGQTVYGFDDASANITFTIPIVPVTAAIAGGQESWSSPATWNNAPIFLANGGIAITGNLAQQAGAYLAIPASAPTLTADGPNDQPVTFYGINLQSTAVAGVNASFTLTAPVSYSVTIADGANVNMDQQGVAVNGVNVASGGTLIGDGNFVVYGDLDNNGTLDSVAGTVWGNFNNASISGGTADADITGPLYLQGGFSNQGIVGLEQFGALYFSGPAVNNGEFDLKGGSLSTDGSFTNNAQFNWFAGVLPSIINSAAATLSIVSSSSKYLPPNGLLTNYGTILQVGSNSTFAIDGDINNNTSQSEIATVNNQPGGVYNLQGDGQIANQTSGFGYVPDSAFNNTGLFEKTDGTGTSDISTGITFNNAGTVEVDSGTLQFDGGGSSNTATYVFKNGGQIIFDSPFLVTGANTGGGSGALTITSGGALLGPGSVNFGGGNLVVSDQATIGSGLTNAGQLTIDAITYDASVTGTFTNTGTINHISGTLQINPNSTLNNYGTIQQIGANTTLSVDGNFNSSTSVDSPSTMNNFAGALYNLDGNGGVTNPTSAFGLVPHASFNNYGLFEKSAGAGTSYVGAQMTFNNSGAVQVQSGTLEFDGGVVNTGSLFTAPGTQVTFNGPLTGGAAINNQGWMYVNAGGSVSGNIGGNGGLAIGLLGNPTTLQLAPYSGTTHLSVFTMNPNSTFDVTNNTVAINFASPAVDPVSQIAAGLANGYHSGTWTGAGIVSSTAATAVAGGTQPLLSVGYADGNIDTATAAAANQVLIKFTLAGDANLDGNVDFTDLFAVGKHLNTTGNDWASGNFDYSSVGAVDFDDLFILGQNLNMTLGTLGSSSAEIGGTNLPISESVSIRNNIVMLPEPSAAALVAVGAAGILLCRRRRVIA